MVMTNCPVMVGYRMQVINKQKVHLSQKGIQWKRGNRKISPKMQSKEDSSDGDGTKEDYVHVRAKRGQATNSHSLAERVNFALVASNYQFSLLYYLYSHLKLMKLCS